MAASLSTARVCADAVRLFFVVERETPLLLLLSAPYLVRGAPFTRSGGFLRQQGVARKGVGIAPSGPNQAEKTRFSAKR